MSLKRSLLTLSLIASAALSAAASPLFQSAGEIAIGGEGGWDILSVDEAARRLYLSHSTKVIVVDIDAQKVVGEIADTPGVHAFLAVPALGRGFSSNGKENKASVVDLKTLKTTAKLETGDGPDAIAYDEARGEVYVFNHKGGTATVINAKSAKVVATISLGGSPEFGVADSAAGRVYCNIEDKSEVVAIDTAKHEVVNRWPLAPGQEPSGIALDAAHHRLFSTCDNKLMTMLDTQSGKVVGSVPIGEHVDGCAFDDAMQLAFASCGEGLVTIAKEEAPDRLTVAQTLKTERGARTIALDPETHRIFLPTAQFEDAPSPSPGVSPMRPKSVQRELANRHAGHVNRGLPGTFKLLVYGPAKS